MAGVKGMRDKMLNSPAKAEIWRASIRIGLIRNRLMKHFLGEIELSQTQLKAAEILINKTLPNMASVEHTGEVTHNYVARVPQQMPEANEWAQQHSPIPQTVQ